MTIFINHLFISSYTTWFTGADPGTKKDTLGGHTHHNPGLGAQWCTAPQAGAVSGTAAVLVEQNCSQ